MRADVIRGVIGRTGAALVAVACAVCIAGAFVSAPLQTAALAADAGNDDAPLAADEVLAGEGQPVEADGTSPDVTADDELAPAPSPDFSDGTQDAAGAGGAAGENPDGIEPDGSSEADAVIDAGEQVNDAPANAGAADASDAAALPRADLGGNRPLSIVGPGPVFASTLTYRFISADGEVVSTQMVKEGDVLYEPEVPEQRGSATFLGWFEEDADEAFDGFGTVGAVEADATVTLYARYGTEKVAIRYHDQDGNVVAIEEVAPNATVQIVADAPLIETNKLTQQHVGWATAKDGTQDVSGSFKVGAVDFDLYPIVKEGYWVTFASDGGTAYPRQFIDIKASDKTADDPGKPYKKGYVFDGWYADEALTVPFDFSSPVTGATAVHAKYVPADDTMYTVMYWIEYQSDVDSDTWDYKWIARKTEHGTTGELAEFDDAYIFASPYSRSSAGYALNEDKTVAPAIAADGTTIYNVYYDCNTFHISFRWDGAIRVEADLKYTASTRKLWDVIDEARGEESWRFARSTGSGTEWVSSFADGSMMPDYDCIWSKTNNPNHNLFYRIYLETLEGEAPAGYDVVGNTSARVAIGSVSDDATYYLYGSHSFNAGGNGCASIPKGWKTGFTIAPEVSDGNWLTGSVSGATSIWFHAHRNSSASSSSTWTYRDLYNERLPTDEQGYQYEFIPAGASSYQWNFDVYHEVDGYLDIYFKRNQYELTFHENGGQDVDDELVYYEKNLASYEPAGYVVGQTTMTDGAGREWTFAGWYTDTELTEEFDGFAETDMPAYNIDLYAKWVPVTYTVTFDSNGGSAVEPAEGLEYGQMVAEPSDPERDGYIFLGWSLDGRPYNFGSGVSRNITLVAQWRSVEAFPVTYDLNGGSGSAPSDDDAYYEDAGVTVASEDGVVAPAGKVFLGWKSSGDGLIYYANGVAPMPYGGLTLTAQWGDVPATVQITYDFNYATFGVTQKGTNEDSATVAGLPNNLRLALAKFAAFGTEPQGFSFGGWYLDASCTDGPYDSVQIDDVKQLSTNVVYAKWIADPTPEPTPDPEPDPKPAPQPEPEPDPAPAPVPANLRYDPNGGSGTMDPAPGHVGDSVFVARNGFVRDGYRFAGWNTAPDGSGTWYRPGQEYLLNGDAVLYAIWEAVGPELARTADETSGIPAALACGAGMACIAGGVVAVRRRAR